MKSLTVHTILLMIAMGIGLNSVAQQSGRGLDKIVLATDNVTIQVDTTGQTTKTPETPFVDFTYQGIPLTIYLNDEQGSSQDGDWSLINSSVPELDLGLASNILYSDNPITVSHAGQDYNFAVRVNSETNGPNGALQKFTDEFDHYRSDITLTYVMNGETYTSTFRSPNSATDHVFDFGEPFPFHASYGLDNVSNPVEFENAIVNLGNLFDSETDLMDVKVDQRNANDSEWSTAELLYQTLVQNLGTTVDPYPVGIVTEMIDYTDKKASLAIPSTKPADYKSSGKELVFDPPLGIDQVISPNSLFGHTYTSTMENDWSMPVIDVENLSPNLEVDTVYTRKIGPMTYQSDVIFKAGPNITTEDFNVNFTAMTVGQEEQTVDDLVIKYGPNPFSNQINMSYDLSDNYDMQVNVYNTAGQLIQSVDLGRQTQGQNNFSWGPAQGTLPDGMYIIKISGKCDCGNTMHHSLLVSFQNSN